MNIFVTKSASHLNLKASQIMASRFLSGESKISVPPPTSEKCIVIACVCNNDDFIELLLLLDALRGYQSINLILTYLFYSRDDKSTPNASFGARVIKNALQTIPLSKVVLLDPHSNFFSIKNTEISAFPLFANEISQIKPVECVLVAPDEGIYLKVLQMASALNISLVRCTKIRSLIDVHITIHGDVANKNCILVDDIIDSYGTIQSATLSLLKQGARSVRCYCTHGVLSPGSVQRIINSPISEVVITDSICRHAELNQCDKIRVISIRQLVQDVIDGML